MDEDKDNYEQNYRSYDESQFYFNKIAPLLQLFSFINHYLIDNIPYLKFK